MSNTIANFDTRVFRLGSLCLRNHRYGRLNQSLRYIRSGMCVPCAKQHQARARKRWAEDHEYRERIKKKHREHYQKTKDQVREKQKKWVSENRDKVRKAHRRREGRDRRLKNNRAIAANLRRALRDAISQYYQTGRIRQSQDGLIDYGAIIEHLGPRPSELGKAGDWHVDHIIPLSKFDLTDPEQVKLAFAPENHQWIPAKHNLQKGNRLSMQTNMFLHNQEEIAGGAEVEIA